MGVVSSVHLAGVLVQVIPVAQLFLLENVISSCREYLTSHLNTKHVWRAQRIADTFALSDVKDAVDSYMLKHLVELAETPEFFDLSVVELCRSEALLLMGPGLRSVGALGQTLEPKQNRVSSQLLEVQPVFKQKVLATGI